MLSSSADIKVETEDPLTDSPAGTLAVNVHVLVAELQSLQMWTFTYQNQVIGRAGQISIYGPNVSSLV